MPRDGVQTRAQRKKKEDNGTPASPIQMLPLERPRKPRVPKAAAAPVTIPQNAPAPATGSEPDRTEEPSQDQESAHAQNPETDIVTDVQGTQDTQYSQDIQVTEDPQNPQDIQDTQGTHYTQGSQDIQEQVDPSEPTDSETATSSLTPDQVPLNAPSSAPAVQSGSSTAEPTDSETVTSSLSPDQASLNAPSSAPAVQSGSSTAEPTDSETVTSSLSPDQASLNAPSSAPAVQSGSSTAEPTDSEIATSSLAPDQVSLDAPSSAPAVQSGSSTVATPIFLNAPSSASAAQSSSQSVAGVGPALPESIVIDFTQDEAAIASFDSSFSDFDSPPMVPLAPRSRFWARRSKNLESFKLKRASQPNEKFAVLHLWSNASMAALASASPDSEPTLAIAVPMARLGHFLRSLAADYSGGSPAAQQKLTVSTATQTVANVGDKRKATDDPANAPPNRRVRFKQQDTTAQTKAHRIVRYKPAPLYDADGMLQLGEPDIPVYSDEEEAHPQARPSSTKDRVVHTTAPQIETAPASEAAIETVPETPSSRWALGRILNSASRFVPGLGRRTAPTAATQRSVIETSRVNSTPQVLRPQHPRIESRGNTQAASSQDVNALSNKDTPATEQSRQKRRKPNTVRQAQSHKVSKTQVLPEREYRQARRMREKAEAAMTEVAKAERRKVQLGEIKEKKHRLEIDEKKIEDEIVREESEAALKALNDWRDERRANPGLKRPRPPSPKVIPNPIGCSYGFDIRYFEQSSSEEESSPPSSPTHHRPRKSPRTEGVFSATDGIAASKVQAGSTQAIAAHTNDVQAGTEQAHKAQIYTGAFFGDRTPTHQGGNVFGEIAASSAAVVKASAFKQAIAATPKAPKPPKSPPRTSDGRIITNLSGHFCFPEDDTDEEVSQLSGSPSPSANKANGTDVAPLAKSPIPGLPTLATSQLPSQLPLTTATPSDQTSVASSTPASAAATEKAKVPAWSQPPPAPPIPSHATLPSFPTADSDSLNAARAKALKHAPKKPSTLRESTRLASSPQAATEEQAEASVVTFPTTRRKSTDEIIAEMEQDVASKPPPPLHEILNVLAEKSPNGQVKSPFTATAPYTGNKVPGSNDTPLVEPAKAPSVEPSQVPVVAAPFIISAPLPDPADRDETLVNYYGIQAPTWQAQYVDENWTAEMTASIDLRADFEEFCATSGISPDRVDDPEVNFTQEDADAIDLTEDFYDYCRQTGQSPTVFSATTR